jgi:glycosyltransferase involved in cell wall biosynthesis
MSKGDYKIALVHDELIRRGGAEVVFEELMNIFPQADVHALYAGGDSLTVNGTKRSIKTSFLQKFPRWMRRHPKHVLPLLPHAAEKFDFSRYDLVLSSASAFAKAVVTRANVPHVCYCHTPTRYLWEPRKAREAHHAVSPFATMLLHYLRIADYAAAQRVDVWLANSKYTQQRIEKYYRRPSEVIYPPVRTDFFYPLIQPRRHFLVVGRLTPSKRFADAIAVCEKLRLPLVVVGIGSEFSALRKLAGKYTTFVGYASDTELRDLYRSARALLQPGVEDFGITSVEALACGTPVVAQAAGGVKEIVSHRQHGILHQGQGVEALAEGIRQFLAWEAKKNVETLQRRAMEFSSVQFREGIQNTIARVLAARNTGGDEVHAVYAEHRTLAV